MPQFVTCLNCMDGRTQEVMIDWLKQNYQADYVDMITEAGIDGYIFRSGDLPEELCHKIEISLNKHGSNKIFIIGHYDCGGHPVDEATHRKHTTLAAEKLSAKYPDSSVTGIWISDNWQPEKIIELP